MKRIISVVALALISGCQTSGMLGGPTDARFAILKNEVSQQIVECRWKGHNLDGWYIFSSARVQECIDRYKNLGFTVIEDSEPNYVKRN